MVIIFDDFGHWEQGTLAVGEDVHIIGLSGMRAEIDAPCEGWISTLTATKESAADLMTKLQHW